jgi:hypothetical protein
MSDTDEMTDRLELCELRDAMSTVALPARPPLATITARGHARLRRRLYSLGVVAVVGMATLTTLVVRLGDGSVPVARLDPIRTAAYTIVTNADGTTTLTIDTRELFDPAVLESDLAERGIPAKVRVGSFCTSDPAPSGFAQVVSYDAGSPSQPSALTIDAAAMPSGTALSFGSFQMKNQGLDAPVTEALFALIDSASFTCVSSPPRNPPAGGAGFLGYSVGPDAS